MAFRNSFSNSWVCRPYPEPSPSGSAADDDIVEVYNSSSSTTRSAQFAPQQHRFPSSETGRFRFNGPRARQPLLFSSNWSNPNNPPSHPRQNQPGAFNQRFPDSLASSPRPNRLATQINPLETNVTFSFKDFDATALQILMCYGFNNVLSLRTLQAWYLRFVKHVREHNNRLNNCVSQLERDHSRTSVCIQLQEGMQPNQRAQPYFGDDYLSVVFEEYNNANALTANSNHPRFRYGQNAISGETPETKLRNVETTLQKVLNDPSNGTLSVTGEINSFSQDQGEDLNEENAYRDKWNPINCDLPFPVFVQHVNWKLATSPQKRPLPHFNSDIFKLRYVEHMSKVENNDKAFLLATTTAYGHDMAHYPLRVMELLKRTGIFRETSREFNTDFGNHRKAFIGIHRNEGNTTEPRQSKLPSNQFASTSPISTMGLNTNISVLGLQMSKPELDMRSQPQIASSRPLLSIPGRTNQNLGFDSTGANIPPLIAFTEPNQQGSILNEPTKVLRNPIKPDELYKKKMQSVRAELFKPVNSLPQRAANNTFGRGRQQFDSMATPAWSSIPSLNIGREQGLLPLPAPVPPPQNRVGPVDYTDNSRPVQGSIQKFKFQLPDQSFKEKAPSYSQDFEGYSTVAPSISSIQKFPDRGYMGNQQHESEIYNRDPAPQNSNQYQKSTQMKELGDTPIKLPYELTFDIWKLVCEKSRRFIHHSSDTPLRTLTEDEYRIWYARYLYHVEENYSKFLQGIKSGFPPANYPQEVRDMITYRQLIEERRGGINWEKADGENEEQQGLTLDWQTRDLVYENNEDYDEDSPRNSTRFDYGHNSERGQEIFHEEEPYVEEKHNDSSFNPAFDQHNYNQDRYRPGFPFKRPRLH